MNRSIHLPALIACLVLGILAGPAVRQAKAIDDSSPLAEKAAYLEQDLKDKHSLDGLYVSIVPSAPAGTKLKHTVDEGGNVIHAGVWTGRYLGGVGYQYAVTHDPKVREHGGQILQALRIQQEVTGKAGLLARGYVKGHGPVAGWERGGGDSKEWHQGQGKYADYRWYGDVSVDNFNAVLYGYAIYYDLAADEEQKKMISHDVDRLMTHLLDNHCRLVDVDNEVTMWGHVGVDPDPARVEYYKNQRRVWGNPERASLRQQLMLLPDLLIAYHVTGKDRYKDFYKTVVDRCKQNPEPQFGRRGGGTSQSLARVNHSSEGQAYEAMYNLVRYEKDPELLSIYRPWVSQIWDRNWTEGNSVFTYMTLALLPQYRTDEERKAGIIPDVPHAAEGLKLANESLTQYHVDRVMRPVMNSIRKDIELNSAADRFNSRQAAQPLAMKDRPLDNEYCWKGNPYQLDGWIKPNYVVAFATSCDDPQVAWFCDSSGRLYMTVDRGKLWEAQAGAGNVKNIAASKSRTFVVWLETDNGVLLSRDGGMSAKPAAESDKPEFAANDFHKWLEVAPGITVRVDDAENLVRSTDGGKTSQPAMKGWYVPRAKSVLRTPWGIIASGPGGAYRSDDGENWEYLPLWSESETGPADFLHAYWMGRYYGFVKDDSKK